MLIPKEVGTRVWPKFINRFRPLFMFKGVFDQLYPCSQILKNVVFSEITKWKGFWRGFMVLGEILNQKWKVKREA